jgi:hypothetical protein
MSKLPRNRARIHMAIHHVEAAIETEDLPLPFHGIAIENNLLKH